MCLSSSGLPSPALHFSGVSLLPTPTPGVGDGVEFLSAAPGLGNHSLLLAHVPRQGPDFEGVTLRIRNVQGPCEILTIFSVFGISYSPQGQYFGYLM